MISGSRALRSESQGELCGEAVLGAVDIIVVIAGEIVIEAATQKVEGETGIASSPEAHGDAVARSSSSLLPCAAPNRCAARENWRIRGSRPPAGCGPIPPRGMSGWHRSKGRATSDKGYDGQIQGGPNRSWAASAAFLCIILTSQCGRMNECANSVAACVEVETLVSCLVLNTHISEALSGQLLGALAQA
jgi:hypothetical protein